MQGEIIASVLASKDTLALLPTGGGKSICYQVPALAMEGICLVITPLVALMKDQAGRLRQQQISSTFIHAAMTWKETTAALKEAVNGRVKFLYVSPERLQSGQFRDYAQHMDISLMTVDEAHCISEWGYDFRPAYLKIASFRECFPDTPVLALTATATARVIQDIQEKLQFRAENVFRHDFSRKNIAYSVLQEENKPYRLLTLLERIPGSSLIYCRSRKQTLETAETLRKSGIAVAYYHAGLSPGQRSIIQDEWTAGQLRVMVCTSAFGLGIDKPDVRCVIHYDIPDSLEAYFQQSGRAGRDGGPAEAVLLFHPGEFTTIRKNMERRYPSPEGIRKVYQAVVNYLQVPAGSGEMQYYDFDPLHFSTIFGMNVLMVQQVMKMLEQEGVCTLSERIYLPSRVRFSVDRATLEQFEKDHPFLEWLTQVLLRTYPGVFDDHTPVQEKQISRKLGIKEEEIIRQLHQLDQFHIIHYLPCRNTPQLCFLRERVPVGQLNLDIRRMQQQKENSALRIQAVINYATGNVCRNQQLMAYFDQNDCPACGICDICRGKNPSRQNNLLWVTGNEHHG